MEDKTLARIIETEDASQIAGWVEAHTDAEILRDIKALLGDTGRKTLRDEFAMAALVIYAAYGVEDGIILAKKVYGLADAMLAKRNKQPEVMGDSSE